MPLTLAHAALALCYGLALVFAGACVGVSIAFGG